MFQFFFEVWKCLNVSFYVNSRVAKIVEFPYTPYPASPNVNILHKHSVVIKTRKLTPVQYC